MQDAHEVAHIQEGTQRKPGGGKFFEQTVSSRISGYQRGYSFLNQSG
jgi:hypothetical protein